MTTDKMSKAKVRLLLRHVFFASILLSTRMIKDETCETAWTDMTKIGYNPKFIDSLDQDLVIFVIVHELWHIILKHGLRMQGRNPDRWNRACDYAINWMMKEQGFKIWEFCLIDEKYAGKSAEEIYGLLEQEDKQKASGKGQGQGQGTGQGGSGAGQGGKSKQNQGGMSGDVRRPENLDPETRAKIEQTIDQQVARASAMARMAGQMTGSLERVIGEILNPPQRYQDLLRDLMTRMTHDTESWSRRNRRNQDIYLPTRYNPAMGEIIVIGDTSGSVNDDECAQIGGEINECAETMRPERIRVVWADTEVKGEQVFEEGDPCVIEPKGGGGTDMRVPLRYVEKYDPVVVILITDGETPWPKEEPPYPLIVMCTTNAKCPVGHVVRMRP